MSATLAETLGLCGAAYSVAQGKRVVGLDINANYLRGSTSGWVAGVARPVHIGRSTQVRQVELTNDAGELTCVARITMAVLTPKPATFNTNKPTANYWWAYTAIN